MCGLSSEEAKRHVLERSEELVRHEMARMVRQMEEEARPEAKRRARNLVADALQRVAASHAAEGTEAPAGPAFAGHALMGRPAARRFRTLRE